jgi:hypothetical protein
VRAAAPNFLQGLIFGTYSIAQVKIPLADTEKDGVNYAWNYGRIVASRSLPRTDRETWFPANACAG